MSFAILLASLAPEMEPPRGVNGSIVGEKPMTSKWLAPQLFVSSIVHLN